MEVVKVTYMDLDEIVKMSGTDEGMHDLLSKVKEYYLLKRTEPSQVNTSLWHGAVAFSGNSRQLNTMYTNTGGTRNIMIAVNAAKTDRVSVYTTGHHLYATFDLTAGMSYAFTFSVFPGEDYWIEGGSTTLITKWVEQ